MQSFMVLPDNLQSKSSETETSASPQTEEARELNQEDDSTDQEVEISPSTDSFNDLLKQLRARKFAQPPMLVEDKENEVAEENQTANSVENVQANQKGNSLLHSPEIEKSEAEIGVDTSSGGLPESLPLIANHPADATTGQANEDAYRHPLAQQFHEAIEHLKAQNSALEITDLYRSETEPPEATSLEDAEDFDADEDAPQLEFVIEELSKEVRKVGREVFKSNRVAERNQETFASAIEEIRQLAGIVAEIPAQAEQSIADAVFEAKAQICRELLRVADSMEASLAAADDWLATRQSAELPNANRWLLKLPSANQLQQSLSQSIEALKKWRDGQQLIYERVMAILRSAGARPIDSQVFDPTLQRAVSIAQNASLPNGAIAGEELKGYTLDGKILRYAEVIVIKNE